MISHVDESCDGSYVGKCDYDNVYLPNWFGFRPRSQTLTSGKDFPDVSTPKKEGAIASLRSCASSHENDLQQLILSRGSRRPLAASPETL
jgi:hypothetical protein